LQQFKQRVTALELVPAGGGCFEVELDGELVYSKLKTGSFPDDQAIVKLVRKRLS
jgi:selenoprotein W-related protein